MKTPQEVLDAWDFCHEERDYSTGMYGGFGVYVVRGEKGISMHFGEHDSAIRAALEKQVPKAIVVETVKFKDGYKKACVFDDYTCPSCGCILAQRRADEYLRWYDEKTIPQQVRAKRYCSDCGQTLDWGNAEAPQSEPQTE